jgi:hypothetical protein
MEAEWKRNGSGSGGGNGSGRVDKLDTPVWSLLKNIPSSNYKLAVAKLKN